MVAAIKDVKRIKIDVVFILAIVVKGCSREILILVAEEDLLDADGNALLSVFFYTLS